MLKFFIILFLSSSCAKLSYMVKQGTGHLSLEWNGVDNEKVLKDPKVSDEHKRKIRLIEKYKNFFYKYFKKEPTNIYTETTFLETEAVTYLVIGSKKDKIAPLKHSFPFAGTFPYKGYYNKEDALEFVSELKEKGYSTYMRPVYAYSTLDRTPFDDNILSSFFIYKDENLAHLIFHELIHTVFFIDGEVGVNESLAEVIANQLLVIYFKKNETQKRELQLRLEKSKKISEMISQMSAQLNSLYKTNKNTNKVLSDFLKDVFNPKMKSLCDENKIEHCWPLKGEWNNARFAAFGTYQRQQNILLEIVNKNNFTPFEFLNFIEKEYAKYQDSDKFKTFKSYLKEKAL